MSSPVPTPLPPTRAVDKHVSTRLRFRRGMLGYTQGFVARTIGVSFQQVQKYEAGINRLHAYRLYQFSKVLNVPVAYFFEGLEEHHAPHTPPSPNSAPIKGLDLDLLQKAETLRLLRHYYLIENQTLRRCIYDMCRKLGDASERG